LQSTGVAARQFGGAVRFLSEVQRPGLGARSRGHGPAGRAIRPGRASVRRANEVRQIAKATAGDQSAAGTGDFAAVAEPNRSATYTARQSGRPDGAGGAAGWSNQSRAAAVSAAFVTCRSFTAAPAHTGRHQRP
jgi:hypothetical protein